MNELALPAELAKRKVLSQDQWEIKEINLEITKSLSGKSASLSAELIPLGGKEVIKMHELFEQLIPIRGNIFMITESSFGYSALLDRYSAAIDAVLVHRTADAEELENVIGEAIRNRYSGSNTPSGPSMTVTVRDETFDILAPNYSWFSLYSQMPQSDPAKYMSASSAD